MSKETLLATEQLFEKHRTLTTQEILKLLKEEYGIKTQRKTVYADIRLLTKFRPLVKTNTGRCTAGKLMKKN